MYPKIIKDGVRWDHQRSRIAQNTIFGWIISGKLDPCTSSTLNSVASYLNILDINTQLLKFWELEEVHETRSICGTSSL